MKRIIAGLLIAILVFSLAACAEKTKKDNKEADPTEAEMTTDIGNSEVDGGWGEAHSIIITEDDLKMFDKVNKTLTDKQLTPAVYLESQVVAGTNHLVLCRETATSSNAAAHFAIVTVYEDLDGNAEATEFQESDVKAPAAFDPENPTSGGWGEPVTPEVTDEAKTALKKAGKGSEGAAYEAKALLGTQIVAGTNYMLLCKATPADKAAYYTIVTVYADLEGNAEITEEHGFAIDDSADDKK